MPRMSGKAIVLALIALAAGTVALAAADNDDVKKLMNKLLQESELVSVQNVATPEGFKEDNDPNTLQVVFLTDPEAKGKVSEDGEVVFVPQGASVNLQNALTEEAFRRKAKRILEGRAMLKQ